MTEAGVRCIRSARTRSIVGTLILLGALVSGCAGNASDQPNTAGNATNVPDNLPGSNSASGAISVSGLSIRRTGDHLDITAQISNTGTTADELQSLTSQVTDTLTESPALAIPAKSTVALGKGGTNTQLTINARLEPGGSIALIFNFKAAGQVDGYASFSGS
jgi:hypothetical protein